MGLSRSTFYDTPPATLDADEVLTQISAICDEFECYGYRRVGAALRHQGVVVNGKKLRRLMREHDLQPKRRRRYVVTTDSDHGGPFYADLAKDVVPARPNQLWVADLTYVAIPGGFVYLAAVLDAWSRKVVGYAISRSMDARIAVAALKAAMRNRNPPKGCIHHSDRGSQYASEAYRELLTAHGLTGSMSRRGNPYDCKSGELHEDAEGGGGLPGRLRDVRGRHCRPSSLHRRRLQLKTLTLGAGISQPRAVRGSTHPADGQNGGLILSTRRGALQMGVAVASDLTFFRSKAA
jgi:putative transposase